ncbi:MAG: hypothetical protein H7836_13085 [Magnetococcus sp. YQC-3]
MTLQLSQLDFLRNNETGLLRLLANNPEPFRKLFFGHIPSQNIHQGTSPTIDPRTGQQLNMQDLNNPDINSPITHPNLIEIEQRQIEEIKNIISREFIGTIYGGVGDNEYHSRLPQVFGKLKPIIVATYEKAQNIIKQYSQEFTHVVIDESQEFFRPGTRTITADLNIKQIAFMNVIKYTPRNSSLILMTGSTSNETVETLIKIFNDNFNRDFKKIPEKLPFEYDDHATREKERIASENRSQMNIMPFNKMQNPEKLKDLIVDLIRKRESNSLIMVFSLKRATSSGIFKIISDLIKEKRLPIINSEFISGELNPEVVAYLEITLRNINHDINTKLTREKNQQLRNELENSKGKIDRFIHSKFTIDSLPNLYDIINDLEKSLSKIKSEQDYNKLHSQIQELRNAIQNELTSNPWFDENSHFNKDRVRININNVSDYEKYQKTRNNQMTLKDLADRESKNYISPNPEKDEITNDVEFLKYFDINGLEEKGENTKILRTPDPNNLLYQAVLRGIGVMAGGLQFRHKSVIQKLFKEGKIHILFATDALGVKLAQLNRNIKLKIL